MPAGARLYRIARAPYADLSGEGARLAGGRWNRPGRPALYAAESRALAILEMLVHVEPRRVPPDLVLLTLAVPPEVPRESWGVEDLPADWMQIGADSALDRGDRWLAGATAAVLWLPSAVVPQELNALCNPLHPAYVRLRIVDRTPFRFDPRLLPGAP